MPSLTPITSALEKFSSAGGFNRSHQEAFRHERSTIPNLIKGKFFRIIMKLLARIVDAAMLGAIEPFFKQAVVDSSGQVSATHLFERNEESAAIVTRWISETTEATQSLCGMVQVSFWRLD